MGQLAMKGWSMKPLTLILCLSMIGAAPATKPATRPELYDSQLRSEIAKLKLAVAKLEAENAQLREQIKSLPGAATQPVMADTPSGVRKAYDSIRIGETSEQQMRQIMTKAGWKLAARDEGYSEHGLLIIQYTFTSGSYEAD